MSGWHRMERKWRAFIKAAALEAVPRPLSFPGRLLPAPFHPLEPHPALPSFTAAAHVDKHAEASFNSGGGALKAARYQPKPPLSPSVREQPICLNAAARSLALNPQQSK
jgi:hypothetical protein